MKTIRLLTCDNIQEANLIKGNLENAGIPVMLTNENAITLMPHLTGMMGAGIQVMINEEDLELANDILGFKQQSNTNEIVCPNCGSKHFKRTLGKGTSKITKLFAVILSLLMALPMGNLKVIYICKECKTEF